MVALELYGDKQATCTQRVLILLEELNLKYTLHEVKLAQGEHKSKAFLELQPFGKVPAVKYGSKTIFESRAILRYIAKNNAETIDLCPDVQTDVWLEAEGQNFNKAAGDIAFEELWKGSAPDKEVIDKAKTHLESILDIYDTILGQRDFIAGDIFTIADISHIPYAHCLLKCGYKSLFKSRPNVYSWLKRIIRRPAVRAVLDEQVPSP